MSTTRKNDRLVWVDMEMSGLQPETDRILEIAMIVTDGDLNIVAEGPVLVVHQEDAVLDRMDAWNKGTHGKSGLIDKVKASTLTEADVEAECLAFLKQHVKSSISPMCGNTIHQDRRFMNRYMPKLEAYFHYRNIDVSTIKELCKRWQPEIAKGFSKQQAHTALADIIESVEELRYYREKLFIPTIGDEPIVEGN
ncbi:oligoribonuclease [Polynucleobacter sp. AM-26B4]|jgi:oligoribonuclease|uniref:oligoribonuclease n=1 Tax=Polynucleobacter sp. AM-26B4 TaxID=2689103 RepID=UPI001C0B2BBD|nr:oligoribonuclease [Polynucleobacter sp. AM-26B4]MBU3584907.1 oligoribonuclease [Polynucleobacter sp. AM-26B4]